MTLAKPSDVMTEPNMKTVSSKTKSEVKRANLLSMLKAADTELRYRLEDYENFPYENRPKSVSRRGVIAMTSDFDWSGFG